MAFLFSILRRGSILYAFSLIPRRLSPICLLEWRECMTAQQKEQVLRLRASGVSYGSIASTLGLSVNTVKSCCKRSAAAVPKESAPVATQENKSCCCPQCGTVFIQTPGHRQKRFCSAKCRTAWWAAHSDQMTRPTATTTKCSHCGQTVLTYPSQPRKFCSWSCYLAHRYERGGDAHA